MEINGSTRNRSEPYLPGTRVKILHSRLLNAEIVSDRGLLGPRGARVYRVMAVRRPRMYLEVLEEQLEVIEDVTGLPSAGM